MAPDPSSSFRRSLPSLLGLALLKLIIHLGTSTNYGPFSDELYFLACGRHLDWGYVDMPALTAVQARLAEVCFGTSLMGLHFLPALQGAALVLLTGWLTAQLGGSRSQQCLAALAILPPGVYLQSHSYLSMNALEPLLWGAVLSLLIGREAEHRWLWIGLWAGLAVHNKHTALLFLGCLGLGLGLTRGPWRAFLKAMLVTLLLALPNLLWQVQHHFPHLEFYRAQHQQNRLVVLPAWEFAAQQILLMNPVTFPLWLLGLGWLARQPRYRFVSVTYGLMLVALIVLQARVYYLAPFYPVLLAAGARAWLAPRWQQACLVAVMLVGGALGAPFALPLLPPEDYLRYAALTGWSPPKLENRPLNRLPELFAGRFNWPEMTAEVARVYARLPAGTTLLALSSAKAGALDWYGPALGLPAAVCPHLSYFDWGPGPTDWQSVLVVGELEPAHLEEFFQRVEPVGRVASPYATLRGQFELYWCSLPRQPMSQRVWSRWKTWQ